MGILKERWSAMRTVIGLLEMFSTARVYWRRRLCMVSILALTMANGWSDVGQTTPLMGNTYPVRENVNAFYEASQISWDQLNSAIPKETDVLIWMCHSVELPREAYDPIVVNNVRQFVERGGGLLLLGYAPAWVVELGLESEAPDGVSQRWFHRKAVDQGVRRIVSHPVLEGLSACDKEEDVFWLACSEMLVLRTCGWRKAKLQNGRTLAHTVVQYGDKIRSQAGLKILNEWNIGRGKVLGYGHNALLDPLWQNDHQDNLQRFLRNAVTYLGGKKKPRIAALPETPTRLHADGLMSLPMNPKTQPHTFERSIPGLPYIGHWGWLGPIHYQRAGRQVVGPDYFRKKLIDEPWRWGGNLLEFFPVDHWDMQFPFKWTKDDPIPRPAEKLPDGFKGQWPGWTWQSTRELVKYAHDRDFLFHTFYLHNNFKKTDHAHDFIEFQGLMLMNGLAHGWERCQDGVGLEGWSSLPPGMVYKDTWLYNPGSYFYCTSGEPGPSPAFTRAWFADMNGARWEYVFHAPTHLGTQADSRSRLPGQRDWGQWLLYGGGSTGDWIVREANDFARDRLYLDSAIWWLGEPESTLPSEERPYVYLASTDPIRCAAAFRMDCVGIGGFRDRKARAEKLHPAWTHLEAFPHDTAAIQNNYIRVYRRADADCGVLRYDPTRLAQFDEMPRPVQPIDLSTGFIELADGAEAATQSDPEVVVAIGAANSENAEFRGPGGYEENYRWSKGASNFPRELRDSQYPKWPENIEIPFDAMPGRYRLDIHTLHARKSTVALVLLDGELAGYFFPNEHSSEHELAFSISEPGEHVLTLASMIGHYARLDSGGNAVQSEIGKELTGLVAVFDAVRIVRLGNTAITHKVSELGGNIARLEEKVVLNNAGTTYQLRRYEMTSDTPMLKIEIENQSPTPKEWKCRINTENYRVERAKGNAGEWRLEPRAPEWPSMTLMLLDGDAKISIAKEELLLTFPKRKHSRAKLGLAIEDGLYDAGDTAALRQHLTASLVTLQADKEAPITRDNPLPIARVEIVKMVNPEGGPFMVAEENASGERWWTARGVQGETNWLKVYHQPNGQARIQPAGFIEGVVKPGWGCQYSLAIRDQIEKARENDATEKRRCEVQVLKTGPFLFAPRIEWKQPFDSVSVDGRPWRYTDGRMVFLPNRAGRYIVEVSNNQALNKAPSLARTFMDVKQAEWDADKQTLVLEMDHPHYWRGPLGGTQKHRIWYLGWKEKVLAGMPYTAMILSEREPVAIEGPAEMIAWDEYRVSPEDLATMRGRGFMLRVYPGVTRLRFK
jgi:hypothetical protein